MILDALAEYVLSHLLDRAKGGLPDSVLKRLDGDTSLGTLLERDILPKSLEVLVAHRPDLQADPNLVEQVIAPAIAHIILHSVLSGELGTVTDLQAQLDKLLAHDLTSEQRITCGVLLVDYQRFFYAQLAQHQSAGDALIVQYLALMRAQMDQLRQMIASLSASNDAAPMIEVTTLKPTHITVKASQLPHNFVPRPREFEPLVVALAVKAPTESGTAVALTAGLRGAGGYGKTTLAKALCGDSLVKDAYPDGIHWVTLGEKLRLMQPEIRENELIARMLDLVKEITGERPNVQKLDAAHEELAKAVANKRILIVIDDVWEESHAKPFLVPGKHHATIITTRFDECIPKGDQVIRQKIDQMDDDDALALLAFGVEGWQAERNRFEEVAFGRLGRSAQLLGIINGAITERLQPDGEGRIKSLSTVLAEVTERLEYYGVTAFQPDDPEEREKAFGRTLEVGIERLKSNEQSYYRMLGIFLDDVPVPLRVLGILWGLKNIPTQDFCERLAKSSLVQDYDDHILTIHDVTLRYLRNRLSDAHLLHYRLIEGWGSPHALSDSYALEYYAYHMIEAGQADKLRDLLFDPQWLLLKYESAGLTSIQSDINLYLRQIKDDSVVKLLRDAFVMSAHISDGNHLLIQVGARLAGYHDDTLQQFVTDIKNHPNSIQLISYRHAIEHTGGYLVRNLIPIEYRGEEIIFIGSYPLDYPTQFLVVFNQIVRIWDSSKDMWDDKWQFKPQENNKNGFQWRSHVAFWTINAELFLFDFQKYTANTNDFIKGFMVTGGKSILDVGILDETQLWLALADGSLQRLIIGQENVEPVKFIPSDFKLILNISESIHPEYIQDKLLGVCQTETQPIIKWHKDKSIIVDETQIGFHVSDIKQVIPSKDHFWSWGRDSEFLEWRYKAHPLWMTDLMTRPDKSATISKPIIGKHRVYISNDEGMSIWTLDGTTINKISATFPDEYWFEDEQLFTHHQGDIYYLDEDKGYWVKDGDCSKTIPPTKRLRLTVDGIPVELERNWRHILASTPSNPNKDVVLALDDEEAIGNTRNWGMRIHENTQQHKFGTFIPSTLTEINDSQLLVLYTSGKLVVWSINRELLYESELHGFTNDKQVIVYRLDPLTIAFHYDETLVLWSNQTLHTIKSVRCITLQTHNEGKNLIIGKRDGRISVINSDIEESILFYADAPIRQVATNSRTVVAVDEVGRVILLMHDDI